MSTKVNVLNFLNSFRLNDGSGVRGALANTHNCQMCTKVISGDLCSCFTCCSKFHWTKDCTGFPKIFLDGYKLVRVNVLLFCNSCADDGNRDLVITKIAQQSPINDKDHTATFEAMLANQVKMFGQNRARFERFLIVFFLDKPLKTVQILRGF